MPHRGGPCLIDTTIMTVSLIPESAPFTEEQRAWLNGFLAGWTGIVDANGNLVNGGAEIAAGLLPEAEVEEEEDFPWHDPAIEIEERLKLAEDRPLERRMMAAMAQLNCGACGYLCQTYSEAIASGDEKNLTLCSPGGKETAKMLKKLAKERGEAPAAASNGAAPSLNGSAATNGFTRANPYTASIRLSENQNKEGSSKHTSHVVINLGDSGIEYVVGDSLGVFPTNCKDLVEELKAFVDNPTEEIERELFENRCLRSVTDELLELLAQKSTDESTKQKLLGLIDSDDLDTMDVLDALNKAKNVKLTDQELKDSLMEMSPRLYSIASSMKAHPGEVHLTVGRATATIGDRTYKGVASTMFSDRVDENHPVKVYVHKSHGFTVPSDPAAPMVMVGPGTGIAPFRAFLEERVATEAPGKNWLFFGDQHEATDFLYREEFDVMQANGKLDKLSLAFSRDQAEKIYVQDRMREEGSELFDWLEQGGYFFVCGDAKRMAVDVDKALHEVIAEHGDMSDEQAKAYVDKLKADNRYVRDIY